MNMNLNPAQLWQRFNTYYREFPSIGLAMDISRMRFDDQFFASMESRISEAFKAMDNLEKGGLANTDEGRKVGHYWLRNPALASTAAEREAIIQTIDSVKGFAAKVHSGQVHGACGPFANLLVIGIGGSALGPQFVAQALGQPRGDRLKPFFFDNTDPDGMDKVLALLHGQLGKSLVIVISKSGDTKETRNGMLEAKQAYELAGLRFESHAIAITKEKSNLDNLAQQNGWLTRFPMWDWVGGRTSVTSAVGLVPAALQGIDIAKMLDGARACDELTRVKDVKSNPSILLALMWYYACNGKGDKDMVILPYKDRLDLFAKYLQQLIMESLGKELNRNKVKVNQGIAVYGNKGSTDQHAYVQQLRDGVNNFFVTFIEVLKDRHGLSMFVDPGITSGDYLHGFLHGTRHALYENGRDSLTLTIQEVTPFAVGVLIALYERAVGYYAEFININAYHQPGVEAGKKAASELIALKLKIISYLMEHPGKGFAASQIAEGIQQPEQSENIFALCEHLAANPNRHVTKTPGSTPDSTIYKIT